MDFSYYYCTTSVFRNIPTKSKIQILIAARLVIVVLVMRIVLLILLVISVILRRSRRWVCFCKIDKAEGGGGG